ncbi:TPA: phage portal protein [Escherichia coli]|nr:phage portal protein [Escherichia coli]
MKTSTIPTLLGPDGMTSLREYASYHGGGSGFGGQLRAWNPPGESVDAALLPNFTRGNARADDLVRNNGYAANAIQLHQDHIVGSFFRLSHRPSWRYLGIGEEEARAFSREVEAAWKEFAEDDCCCIDVERKRTFTMMIREGVAMHAFNGELFVQATWDTGTLNNVTINENCVIRGKLSANQIEGDLVKTVGKAFPRNNSYASGTVTVTVYDDQGFDRQIIIPPVLFRGTKHQNFNSPNQQSYWYSTCKLQVLKNGVEIFHEPATDVSRVFSSVIDMPAGRGHVTLTFNVSSAGANNWTPTTYISDLLVMVMKKSTAGISIS